MSDKIVSIIVPFFNTEVHLSECLLSIQAQTFEKWECICIDDGSSDKSVEIVNSFVAHDARFRLLRQKNRGPGAARNSGLENTKLKWFTFVDADDVMHTELLMHLLDMVKLHEADLAVCKMFDFSNECDFSEIDLRTTQPDKIKVYHELLLPKMVDWRQFRVHPTGKLYQRSIYGDLRFPELYGAEDAYVSLDIYARSSCAAFSSKQLYGYRIVADSLTHSIARYRNYIIGDTQVAIHCQEVCCKYKVSDSVNAQISKPYIMRIFHYINLMSVDQTLSSQEKKSLMNLAYNNMIEIRGSVAGKFRVIPRIHTIVYFILWLKWLWLLKVYQGVKTVLSCRVKKV